MKPKYVDIDAASVAAFHDECLALADWPSRPRVGLHGTMQVIEENHRWNALLWAEEDLARRRDVADSAIAANKRNIDRLNQQRNDAAERIDQSILIQFLGVPCRADSRLSSESAGAMIDRLSILSLKIRAMTEQTLRLDVEAGHVARCREKATILSEQRRDLTGCLDRLLKEASRGESHFKVYRQFKMYNDPTLNPYLAGIKG